MYVMRNQLINKFYTNNTKKKQDMRRYQSNFRRDVTENRVREL